LTAQARERGVSISALLEDLVAAADRDIDEALVLVLALGPAPAR
jgi:hypothetical protein